MSEDFFVGTAGAFILVVVLLWMVLWFLVPFMLWAITSRLNLIHKELVRQGKTTTSKGAESRDVAVPPSTPTEIPPPRSRMFHVTGTRNGKKFKTYDIEATSEDEAAEKAMVAGIEVLEVR